MSNTKKWLIGCGGCFGVVVLLVIAVVIFLVMQVGSSTDKASETVLGSKPPAGFMSFGFAAPDKKGAQNGFLIMFNSTNQHFVFALNTPLTRKDRETFRAISQASPDAQKNMEALVKKAMGHAASSGQGFSPDQMTLEGTKNDKLNNGKQFSAGYLKVYSEQKGVYLPVVFGIVPEASNQGVILIALDQENSSSDKAADLSKTYTLLANDLHQIVAGTALADRLLAD